MSGTLNMWLWQQHRVPKKYIFLAKLLLFCSSCHLMLLFIGLFIYRGNDFIRQIDINTHSMTVMFLPFYKSSHQEKGTVLGSMPLPPKGRTADLTIIHKKEQNK